MGGVMEFPGREEFRRWLQENCRSDAGVWLLFGKPGGPDTIKAQEALEEALCFGWTPKPTRNIFPPAGRTANGRRKTRRWPKAWKSGAS